LGALAAYKDAHGDLEVPRGLVTPDGLRLGDWVANQRHLWRQGVLSAEREEQLETLGFLFDPRQYHWERQYSMAEAYVDQHGSLSSMVRTFATSDGTNLGQWLRRQREMYRADGLDVGRRQKLEALPGFNANSSTFTDSFERFYQRLEEYCRVHGDGLVPQSHVTEDGLQLGRFVDRMRGEFRRGEMELERQRRLESLPGFTLHHVRSSWDDKFHLLKEYCDDHGHSAVPKGHVAHDGTALGLFVHRQRAKLRAGTLRPEHQYRLEALPGFNMSHYELDWEVKFGLLRKYCSDHGTAQLPPGYVTEDGVGLGRWLANQKAKVRKDALDVERTRRLASLPGFDPGQVRAAGARTRRETPR